MQLPQDQPGFTIRQRLLIEQATLHITCAWSTGVRVEIDCFVPPTENTLVVRWRVEGWTPAAVTGNNTPPVWFSLYRWADTSPQSYGGWFVGWFRHGAFQTTAGAKATALPLPVIRNDGGLHYVEQPFPADPTFPQGFQCLMAPLAGPVNVEAPDTAAAHEARLHLMPKGGALSGTLVVGVATTSDEGGALATLKRMRDGYKEVDVAADKMLAETHAAAQQFWSRSSVAVADQSVEAYVVRERARAAMREPSGSLPARLIPSQYGRGLLALARRLPHQLQPAGAVLGRLYVEPPRHGRCLLQGDGAHLRGRPQDRPRLLRYSRDLRAAQRVPDEDGRRPRSVASRWVAWRI